MTTIGPSQIGQVRKVATLLTATRTSAPRHGGRSGASSHTTSAHQAATAKSSATTCAKNRSCVNEPSTYACGANMSGTEVRAAGSRGAPAGTARSAIRNTIPALNATDPAMIGCTARSPWVPTQLAASDARSWLPGV